MNVKFWPRTPTARALGDLRDEVQRLTAAIDQLTAIQRKEAGQVKKLREAFKARERAWDGVLAGAAGVAAAEMRRAEEARRRSDASWQRRLDRIDEQVAIDLKWRKIFKNQLTALVRRVCMPLDRMPPPFNLTVQRFRLRSQNEEDGILLALLDHAGWGGRRFVEIGSGSSGGNAAVLALECGWTGLMIDLSAEGIESGRRRFARNPGVTLVAASVTPDNVNGLLAQHGCEGTVDLLSIDIDSYDYWILNALTVCSPRLLILEYNALFGPERRVTIPLSQPVEGTPKGYGGASLAALTELAGRKGYRLVACEEAGVNAFFLRHDTAPEVPGVSVAQAYRPLRGRTLDEETVTKDIYEVAQRHGLPLVEV